MAKIKTSVVFKEYNPNKISLLPPSLDELIGKNHLVRVVNDVVEAMDITTLINQYKGGGTTAYHPRMLLKVLLYAYCTKIYTGRRIEKALGQDIHFMWLAASNTPDFRTINNFRSGKAKEAIEGLFGEMLKFLMDKQYIKMENYFCDGSTFRADGNCNKMVWKKNATRYKEMAEQRCKDLCREIDVLNRQEDEEYKGKNLEETGSFSEPITPEVIKQQATKLNQVIAKTTATKAKRTAGRIKKQLEEEQNKITRYDNQIRTAGTRSGYNKTDTDASGLRMKNQETLPAYNVLAGCENQMIVNCSVHQNSNDGRCFKEHMDQLEKITDIVPGSVVADSIFGTEENYQILEDKNIGNYLKYPALHKEEKPLYKPEPFSSTEFNYNAGSDTYTCPAGRVLKFKRVQTEKRYSGYEITLKVYQCKNCRDCPFYQQCCVPRNETRRTLKINPKLEEHKKQARKNLRTEKGWELRKKRSIEIESCFGDIKHNMGIRRCHLRGLKKVHADFCYIAMAHNMRKIYLIKLKKAS